MSSESDEDKVRRYTENLKEGNDPKRALKRLFELQVSSNVFQQLETRKIAKRYLEHAECGKYADRLRRRLKELEKKRARSPSSGEPLKKQVKQEELSSDQLFAKAMGASSQEPAETAKKVDYSKYKVTKKVPKIEPKEEVPDFSYEQQQVQSSSSSHRQERKRNAYSPVFDNAPKISKDYIPSSITCPPPTKARQSGAVQSEASRADENMFKPRKERQKVFAGRKKRILDEVPSLVSACQNVICANVDLIGYVGLTPYHLLKSALLRCNLEQLRKVLDMNPILAEDADELFLDMIKKDFPKYADKEKGDDWTWRELYNRLVARRDEKEKNKLDMLTKRIGRAHQQQDMGRKTMVIDAAHTKNRRKEGPSTIMTATPKGLELSQARKNVKTEGHGRLNSLTAPARAAVRVAGGSASSSSSSRAKPKVAPLMAKVKKMLGR